MYMKFQLTMYGKHEFVRLKSIRSFMTLGPGARTIIKKGPWLFAERFLFDSSIYGIMKGD